MDNAMTVNISALRESLGWSRDKLAEASGVQVSAIYVLERLGWEGTPDDERILMAVRSALNQQIERKRLLVTLLSEKKNHRMEAVQG